MTPAILLPARIIPARAGFTGGRAPRAQGGRDHPRSRGVYKAVADITDTIDGSSPLARGLRAVDRDRHHRRGIIPARAGFTRPQDHRRRRPRDHPRSRGVYSRSGRPVRVSVGSSPLAGGFTRPSRAESSPRADHPRSRGVYAPRTWPEGGAPGSSPLARGLPGLVEGQGLVDGIIPARAGFTSPRVGSPSTAGDHPRSRGVYAAPDSSTRSWAGSSPLARGLRSTPSAAPTPTGIIPARAGFTRGG